MKDDNNVDTNISHLRYNEFITEKTTDNKYDYGWDAGFLQTCCDRKGEWIQLEPGNAADDKHLSLNPLLKMLAHRWTPPLPK
eukprot:2045498-Ditylum_brightwellii.AAC.1